METITVTVSSKGYIMLPASLRKALEIKPGGKMLISREKDRLILKTVPSFTEKLAGLTKKTIAETPDEVAAYIDEQRQDRSE
ncbi:MAG: AbrB/MazE/SpoVT family DNA-binding domain-containing protein [Desulfococcus multivorans]|jgi:AbrB family looped-hinge helix DNA binding protein|nr:AbrB/MazE/SpoVT family DNA-binding domain-containing protein [Desulfococcus multivorans]